MPLRIAILHHEVSAADLAADQDVLVQTETVESASHLLGHEARRWPQHGNLRELSRKLKNDRVDVVFNLFESLHGSDYYASAATRVLEAVGIPFTGNTSAAHDLTNDKTVAKKVIRAAGLPTPDWVEFWSSADENNEPELANGSRWIIKPAREHSSQGMSDDSVVTHTEENSIYVQVDHCARAARHVLFGERYVNGREFNLSLLAGPSGPQVLPPAEIDFSKFPKDKPRIVNYAAKWDEKTFEFQNTPRRFDFPATDEPLLKELKRLAIRSWEVFGLKGYVRVDFRVDQQGQPWILEINTNPCLSPDAGYAAALKQAGISTEEAIQRILDDAFRGHRGAGFQAARQEDQGRLEAYPKSTLRFEPQDSDCAAIRRIVDSTGLFRAPEVDVAVELVEARLAKGAASGYEFVFAEENGVVLGYACFGHNTMTVASFDLYWICVDKSLHGRGVGRQLLLAAEQKIKQLGGQRLYIETSTRPDYLATRGFYLRCGYILEAELVDYYAPSDGKAIFVKAI